MLKVTQDKTEENMLIVAAIQTEASLSRRERRCRRFYQRSQRVMFLRRLKFPSFSDFDNTEFTFSYDPLIGKRKHILKKILNGHFFILFVRMVCLPREKPARAMNTRARSLLIAFLGKFYFSSLNFCRKEFGNPCTCDCLFDVGEKISERYWL